LNTGVAGETISFAEETRQGGAATT